MVKVAIAGGTGAVGRALAETLAQQNVHEAIILSRQGSNNECTVLPTIQVNYDDLEDLIQVLADHEVHTVICAFAINGTSLKKSQMNLIKASSAASSVARFIPTSFSIDYPRAGVEILPPLQDYFDCIDELTKTNLEWSVVLNGIFLDYFSAPPIKSYLAPNAFVIDMANNAAAIPGTGDEMVTFTHTFDVAKYLVAALDLVKWPRELRISGDEMKFKDFVKLAEEVKGSYLSIRSIQCTVCYDTVWTYVEVGVGVVAACLPTLKPIFRGRTLDSIVASVRSVLSIPSNRSRGSNASSRRQRADGTQDLQMYPYGTPKQSHNYSQISGPGSVPGSRAGSTKTDMPALPANAVHRRDDVTVHSSRAVNATSSASEEATERAA
ncbi:hypothetical protein G7054_g6143 [Neopestalotiopsis clavispora]|nr:hypothetical protein G7054_g6143 [Neopestalotiopsis clavispora]